MSPRCGIPWQFATNSRSLLGEAAAEAIFFRARPVSVWMVQAPRFDSPRAMSDELSKQAALPTHVIALGASAGGLEALEEFFSAVPLDTGFAFVVIQHLSPDYVSRMDQLLARQTELPIHLAQDGMELRANQVYLGIPRHEMIVSGNKLRLTQREAEEVFTLPIDHFFRSLADEYGSRAVGIVLSGTGSDGSRGAAQIVEAGGLLISQALQTAQFTGMPHSIVEAGLADLVLAPHEMPEKLLERIHNGSSGPTTEMTQEPLQQIFELLKQESGIDFGDYKPSTVMRRIERRLTIQSGSSVDGYARGLAVDPGEVTRLYRDLLIGVTQFFRDGEAYEQLKQEVVSPLVQSRAGQPIRVWVAGCATGEEAYSLAILFRECADELNVPCSLKLFATDVHSGSLAIASQGEYSEEALEAVSEPRRRQFFRQLEDNRYRIAKDIRTMVVFGKHNLLTDAPFTRQDLVTCRNLLIYLKPSAQKRLLGLFHFALRAGGHLFLGSSETTGSLQEEFESVRNAVKVYKKRRDIRLPLDRQPRLQSPLAQERDRMRPRAGSATSELAAVDLYSAILDDVMPSSLLLSDDYQLLHTFSGAEKYLRVPAGRLTSNALELVDPKLRTPLSGALQQAQSRRQQVSYSGIGMRLPDGSTTEVRVTVRPYSRGPEGKASFLVQLQENDQPAFDEADHLDMEATSTDYVRSLENELRLARENLQATVEELETSNEELQATNEELTASNEELQSTNEELHSVNEELYTVNTEHQFQIRELTQLTNDLNHLFDNIDVGVLFLDSQLRLRKFTSKVAGVLHLQAGDVGRPVEHFVQNLDDGLMEDIQRSKDHGEVVEREVRPKNGPICLLRVVPYWSQGHILGVVISLVDISTLKRSMARLESLSKVIANSSDAIVTLDIDGKVNTWNPGATEFFDIGEADAIGRTLAELAPEIGQSRIEEALERLKLGKPVPTYESARRHRTRGRIHTSEAPSRLLDEHGKLTGIGLIIRDMSRMKHAEEQVRRAVEQRDQFIAVLSHELRNPMMGIQSALDLLQPVDGNESKAHGVLVKQIQQMARILEDLLDVTRMRKDKIEMRRERVDVREIVSDVVNVMQPRIDQSGVDFQTSLPESPALAHADGARLQQVMVNLIGNALKFTPAGGRVKVSLSVEDDRILLVVSDDGTGIAPDQLESIFEPFSQGTDVPRDLSQSGMGLGLALAKAIVRAHEGEIAANSAGKGCGSSFVVSLPVASAADTYEREDSQPPPSGQAGRNVLLVEDEEDNRELTQMLLEGRGHRLTTCGDGNEAVRLLREHAFDVAFIDLGIPEKDGLRVAREARTFPSTRRTRLVALTGHGTQKDRKRTQEAGFDEHLVKPVSIETLELILRGTARRDPYAESEDKAFPISGTSSSMQDAGE